MRQCGKHLHWFYSVSSCEGLELHHKITTIIDHLLPAGFESFTHLGTGVHGWCGWDALEAWTQFQNIRLEPDHEPIRPPLHQQVPAQWNRYHDAMTDHPVLSTQELVMKPLMPSRLQPKFAKSNWGQRMSML